jgi:hypothetical protein
MLEVFIKDGELYFGLTKRDVITKVLPMGKVEEEGKDALKNALLLLVDESDDNLLKRNQLCDVVSKAILEGTAKHDDHLWFYAYSLVERYNGREINYTTLAYCKVGSYDITFLFEEQTDDVEVVEYN